MQQNDRTGILLGLAGFATLSAGDAITKSMAGEWSAPSAAALRFVFGALLLSALLFWREGAAGFRPTNWKLQFARGGALAISSACFFSALFVMPLADAAALVFVSPILVGLLSGPLLGERVSRATWVATAMAFAGMTIILRPNFAALGWAAVLPIAAAFFFALMVIANRAAAGKGSALSMQALIAIVATPVLAIVVLVGHLTGIDAMAITPPDWTVVARCAAIAVVMSVGHWFIYLGTERAGASTIAPTTYVQLLVATALGWALFGEPPDFMTWLGALVIIAAGLYLWSRKRA